MVWLRVVGEASCSARGSVFGSVVGINVDDMAGLAVEAAEGGVSDAVAP